MKQQKLWMVRGPNGGLAPFFGCAFTRKELKERIDRQGWAWPPGSKLVRVIASYEAQR